MYEYYGSYTLILFYLVGAAFSVLTSITMLSHPNGAALVKRNLYRQLILVGVTIAAILLRASDITLLGCIAIGVSLSCYYAFKLTLWSEVTDTEDNYD